MYKSLTFCSCDISLIFSTGWHVKDAEKPPLGSKASSKSKLEASGTMPDLSPIVHAVWRLSPCNKHRHNDFQNGNNNNKYWN